eukprot:m.362290 g.362290  ORF g.362290 m.362290 type:complete len:57 (+) comp20279_c0_seq1:3569-3739(+)
MLIMMNNDAHTLCLLSFDCCTTCVCVCLKPIPVGIVTTFYLHVSMYFCGFATSCNA